MSNAWSVADKRIEIKSAFPSGKLEVDGQLLMKLKPSGDFPLDIEGRRYTLRRKRGAFEPINTLLSPAGKTVPSSDKHTPRTFAPRESMCAKHVNVPAAIVCARCGSFACAACSETDVTHCDSCIAPMIIEEEKRQGDMVLMLPAIVFMVTGGAIGGGIGAGAGALSVYVARKIESKPMKWLAAFGIYTVAAIVMIVAITMVRGAIGSGK